MSGPFGAGALQFFSGAGDFYTHKIDQSLRFEDSNNPYLSKTLSGSGGTIFTFSCWVKLGNIGINRCLLQGYADANNFAQIVLYSGNYIGMYSATSGTARLFAYTQGLQRDPSAWYNIVVKFNGTSGSEEFKIYVNGENQTLTTSTSLSAHQSNIGKNNAHYIGNNYNQSLDMDGHMAEVNFIDGTALDADSFGETKAGIWIPKDTSGLTFGTNGFRLTFAEAGDLGANSSYTVNDIFGDSSAVATYLFDGSIVDAGGTYNGTTTSVTFTDGIVGTQAGVFNGTSSKWVAGTHLFGTHATNIDISLTGWFQVSANYKYIITDGYAGTGGGFFAIYTDGSGRLVAGTGDASGTNNILITGSETVTDGDWHFFAFTKTVSSGTATGKLWVDGNYAGSDTTTSTIAYSNETAFGYFAYSNGYHACVLDQVRIFNRGLTDAEVQRLAGGYGLDSSGNANTFTPVGLQSTDVVLDSPTNNFATLNPLANNHTATMSEGNLKIVTPNSNYGNRLSTIKIPTSGKWYWEGLLVANSSGAKAILGVSSYDSQATQFFVDGDVVSLGYYQETGYLYGSQDTSGSSYGATYAAGDIIGVAVNVDDDEVTFYKNNASQGADSFDAAGLFANFGDYSNSVGCTWMANFGQDSSFGNTQTPQGNSDANGNGDFYYSPPSGFLALCTENLPDPSINPALDEEPADFFNTVTYTGNGTSASDTQAISGVGFSPDFTWIKNRTDAASHILNDRVRGAGKNLFSNGESDENVGGSDGDLFTSFDSDGFTVNFGYGGSTNNGTNQNSKDYVAWNWLAGGSATSYSVGSDDGTNPQIASEVSANTKAGFSIVTFTAPAASPSAVFAEGTIKHGLTETPKIILYKARSATSNWFLRTDVIDGSQDGFQLAGSSGLAKFDVASIYGSPTNQYFPAYGFNTGTTMLVYCFHEVPGYSAIGTYKGNGDSSDGTFVYTGFRPAFVVTKAETDASYYLHDAVRDPINQTKRSLYPNLSAAEDENYLNLDLLSNGFKLRTTTSSNANNTTYFYFAFAEQPFKYSNSR